MPCDRCGGAMDTYELEGRDARSCRECGYVDVPVRHEPEGEEPESWDDAISRFQEQYADVAVSEVDLPASADGSSDETSASESSDGGSGEESSEEASPTDPVDDVSASESPEEAPLTDS